MRSTIHTVIILILITGSAYSQEFKVRLQTGIGTYSMKGLKSINENISNQLPFDTKQVSDFPAYWFYSPSIVFSKNSFSIGPIYSFQSTGSRLSGKDYSGEYRFDMKVNSNSLGVYFDFELWSQQQMKFTFYSTMSAVFSNLEVIEYFEVSDRTLSDYTMNLKALNYSFEPGINYTYPLLDQLSMGINLGYLRSFGSQAYYFGNNKKNKLYDTNKQVPITPEWNGFRFGISLNYKLNHKKPKAQE